MSTTLGIICLQVGSYVGNNDTGDIGLYCFTWMPGQLGTAAAPEKWLAEALCLSTLGEIPFENL